MSCAKQWEENKNPDAVVDYVIEWEDNLDDGDKIISSTWSVIPATISIDSDQFTDDKTKVTLSGGISPTAYLFKNVVDTLLGDRLTQCVYLNVVQCC